jgi:GT2 family glycosyltransferase
VRDNTQQISGNGDAPRALRDGERAGVTSISVFFPCYNDAPTIGALVECAADALDELGIEGDIVVVNDGSADESTSVLTATAAREARLRVVQHSRNRGYGGALQSGFATADREWVFYTDGDAQYDPKELAILVAHVTDDVDVVQGYKLDRRDNVARRCIGRVYHHVVKLLFGLGVRDTDCDFRLIRRSVLERVELKETSGVVCVELVRKLQNAGARFVEVGVHHYPRQHGRSTFFKPRSVARTLSDLVRLWFQLIVGPRLRDARTKTPAPVEIEHAPRPAWRDVLAPFFVSRALSDALLVAASMMSTRGSVFNGFRRWDGAWYSAIALHGYVVPPHVHHHQTPWPFFPLFPVVLRLAADTGAPVALAGVVANHVAFLVALVAIHRLALRRTTRTGANLAVWLTALGPVSFVFSMLYPSAVFLAASAWAFVFVDERRDLAAGIAAALAALSRPNGIVVVVALVVTVGFAARRVVRVVWPVAAALGAWVWFNAARTGDPVRFLDAKRAWHEVTLVGFLDRPTPVVAWHLAVAVVAFGLVLAARKHIPLGWTCFTFMYLVPSLATGIVGMARYASDVFPPYIAGGTLLTRRRNTVGAVFAVLVVAQVWFALFFIAQGRLI